MRPYMEGRPLSHSEFYDDLLKKNFGRNDEFKYRNKLIILLAGIVGLRELELTLVTIDTFISPTGELKEFIVLPETVTRDGFERPIVVSHSEVKQALEDYFSWMHKNGISRYPHKHYLGFDPNAPLLVSDDLKPFKVQSRGKSISPYSMNKKLNSLIVNSGLWTSGVRRISLVRTSVIEGYRSGMSTSDLMCVTGFGEESIKSILTMDYTQYSPVSDWFEQRRNRKAKRLESFKKRRKYMLCLD